MPIQIKTVDALIIDGDHLLHRAYHAFTSSSDPATSLQTVDGLQSGCFFGFFSMILRKLSDLNPLHVVVCWGDRRSNLFRRQMYPLYKAPRDEKNSIMDDMGTQFEDVQTTLSYIGIPQYKADTYEGDDVVANFAARYENRGYKNIILLTGDKDMRQLINDTTFVIAPAGGYQKADKLYDREAVIEKHGVPPELFADFLSLVGDTSDNVPGVKGIGQVMASKLLNKFGPIKTWNINEEDFGKSVYRKLVENKANLILSKKLVTLKNAKVDPVLLNLQPLPFPKIPCFDKYEIHQFDDATFAQWNNAYQD